MNIIGYLDKLSAAPGDTVRGRFSTTADSFDAELVRIYNGDDHPLGPGVDIRVVPSALDGHSFPGREQPLHAGSHVQSAEETLPTDLRELRFSAALRPTLVPAAHRQTVVALTQDGSTVVALDIDVDGSIGLRGPDGRSRAARLITGRWYRLTLAVRPGERVTQALLTSEQGDRIELVTAAVLDLERPVGVAMAAIVDQHTVPQDHFNGRIDSPRLDMVDGSGDRSDLAEWDFGPSQRLRHVPNRLGQGFTATSTNFPMRACLGIAGAPDDVDPRLAPEAYSAIHFHDDDLDDAGWSDDIILTLDTGLPSGVYGLRVTASDGTQDTVPLVVTPTAPAAPVLLVLPTFSYLAYSCEHVMADPGARAYLEGVGVEDPPAFGGNVHDEYLLTHGLRSLYDVHTDLSGVCFASTQKPLPNLRPNHRWAAVAGGATSAHQFSADLHLVSWLERQGIAFDAITDEEVHARGVQALSPYRVVLSGSHPEYHTTPMMKGYEQYLADGGRLMYLGGNGFYWVTSVDPERNHTIEIRRTAGIRAWQPEPGEWHHVTTGELGGLWRLRGRAPQRLLGVGMAAQGFDGNRPYTFVADRSDPRVGFVFDGIDESATLLGNFPSMVNGSGAAGVEIDRADRALGTPDDAIVLATATGFSRAYGLDPIEVNLPDGCYDGTTSDKVRCDLVLVPKPRGGAVFSTGSIAWCGSLLVDDGNNDVARVTENVLRAFLEEELPFTPR